MIKINLHAALPPVTETMTTKSAGRRAVEGLMLSTMGTAASSVDEPAVASLPVVICPKLN